MRAIASCKGPSAWSQVKSQVHGVKCKLQVQGAKCKEPSARSQVQGAKCKEPSARSQVHGVKCKLQVHGVKLPPSVKCKLQSFDSLR